MVEFRELGKWGKRGQMLSLLLVWSVVIYGITLYQSGHDTDRNLAYTAMFMDDLATDIYITNGSYDAVVYASGMARNFCDLYELETRSLEKRRYGPLCDAINARTGLLVMCGNSEYPCSEDLISGFEDLLEKAEPIAKDLRENPPYYGYVLHYGSVEHVTKTGEPITIIPG